MIFNNKISIYINKIKLFENKKSNKRQLKYTADEEDENYGNNYTPIEKKNKKKKNPKKDRTRF